MKSQKGSTLFEFLLSFPAFLAMVGGLLAISYYMVSHHWIRFQLQESMICAERLGRTAECRDQMAVNIKKFLPVGEVLESEIKLLRHQVVGRIDFQILDDFKIEEIQVASRPLTIAEGT